MLSFIAHWEILFNFVRYKIIKGMTSRIKPIIFFTLLIIALVGCTGKSKQTKSALKLPVDTVYTEQAAMNIYETQPARALAIIDSAEIVGNLSNFRAQLLLLQTHLFVNPHMLFEL